MIALGVPGVAGAQGVRVTGRVVRVAGADSQPVGGTWVTLHRVTAAGGGPVDSARSDGRGRYTVRAGPLDSTALYVVSALYHGIAYFTRPVHTFGRQVDTAEILAVFDTSSVAPAITTAQRHIVVRRPEEDGSRRVVELIVLSNAGSQTRIAPDSTQPVWQASLPRGAVQLEVGESDVSTEAVTLRGTVLAVSAPVPPGEKQVVVSYLLPRSARELDLLLDQPVLRLNILVEDSAASVTSGPVAAMGLSEMEGASFARFDGAAPDAGARVRIAFGGGPGIGADSLWWVVVVLAGGAFAATFLLRTRRAAVPVRAVDPTALAAELAAIQAALAARDRPLGDEERAAYERRRAFLEARLGG